MKRKHEFKSLDTLISVILVVFLTVSCSFSEKQDSDKTSFMDNSTKCRFQKRVESFERDPNIDDCVAIMNYYLYLKEYERVIDYGRFCINLGAEKEPPGFIVHLWMAAAYQKKNKFLEAKKHLRQALQLDDKNIITENKNIEIYELQEVYQSIRQEKGQ